jgi:hypothetical protein
MSEFLQQIRSPNFLIFSVLLALVLHVIANYLQRLLDKSLSSGTLFLRGITRRSRERRAARVQQISNWIEADSNRPALALVEANYFCLVGYLTMTFALVGCVAVLTSPPRPYLDHLLEASTLTMICLTGFLTINTGSRIRQVLLQHPKGLSGLHRGDAPRPHV